ncbi:NUDIX hydrolase [Limibacter armeniacum]|uniref:NUDIX hydrolase n=1 Tax=Limibacter armeniacum TaxID=466084 RepID=UPI002FE661C3
MTEEQEKISKIFGNRLRTRVCGICIEQEKVLMIRHRSVGKEGYLWAPPGGGLDYGETMENALKREFKEETGLDINVKRFMFVHEFLQPPLHGIELFFEVEIVGGELLRGHDPEMQESVQIIEDVRFMDMTEINSEKADCVHNLFSFCQTKDELLQMNGLYHFVN